MQNNGIRALEDLRGKLAAESILLGEEARRVASLDAARFSRMPAVVIRPQSEAEVGEVLRVANAYRVPLTVRGAGSATTGAATPSAGGWVLDLSHWQAIRVDAELGMAHVQPGVRVAEIHRLAEAQGWFYPPDPSSQKYATIGGTIATNAGGLRGAKYGVTRDYVVALEGFLPTGEPVRWGLPLRKFASGYNLRDLWVGSEGMLGVVTKAVLKLVPKPQARWTARALFADEAAALSATRALLKARVVPSILEFLDRQTVTCAEAWRGEPFSEKVRGGALLLLELDGHPAAIAEQLPAVQDCFAGALEFAATEDAEEAEQLWEARRICSTSMFQLGDTKLNEDVVVPPEAYLPLIERTLDIREQTGLATPTFGHVADGNFHVHIMYNYDDGHQRTKAVTAIQTLMREVIALGGAITGEHGVGLAKSPFFPWQHTEAEILAMRRIKEALDPQGILNADKMFQPFALWDHPRDNEFRFAWDKKRPAPTGLPAATQS